MVALPMLIDYVSCLHVIGSPSEDIVSLCRHSARDSTQLEKLESESKAAGFPNNYPVCFKDTSLVSNRI